MNFDSIDRNHILKIKSASSIKLRLYFAYSAFFLLFIFIGASVNLLIKPIMPPTIINEMIAFFSPTAPDGKIIKVISSIIYNSIDIFKISIIIIISGFSYIPSTVSRITASIWCVWCGGALYHYITDSNHYISSKAIILAITVLFFYCAIFISNCVNAELMSQNLCEHHTSYKSSSSNHFWKYFGIFLISFGYILIIYTIYTYLYKFLK